MHEQLDQTRIDPATGLTYRLRQAQAGQGKGPCLVLLHGVGSNERAFIDLARVLEPRLNVVLVRGPVVLAPNQYAFFQVNFTASGPVINAQQAERARTTLIDFIGELPQLHDIDPARIWIAGFSQGGIMSASVALTAPEMVSGFGILSGRILPEVLPLVEADAALASLSAFVSHGVQDDVLGIHFAHHAKRVLDQLGVPLTYREYQGRHSLNGAMAGDFMEWLGERLDTKRAKA